MTGMWASAILKSSRKMSSAAEDRVRERRRDRESLVMTSSFEILWIVVCELSPMGELIFEEGKIDLMILPDEVVDHPGISVEIVEFFFRELAFDDLFEEGVGEGAGGSDGCFVGAVEPGRAGLKLIGVENALGFFQAASFGLGEVFNVVVSTVGDGAGGVIAVAGSQDGGAVGEGVLFTFEDGAEGFSDHAFWLGHAKVVEDGGREIEMGNGVGNSLAGFGIGSLDEERNVQSGGVDGLFGAVEADAVVGGENDERVIEFAFFAESIED